MIAVREQRGMNVNLPSHRRLPRRRLRVAAPAACRPPPPRSDRTNERSAEMRRAGRVHAVGNRDTPRDGSSRRGDLHLRYHPALHQVMIGHHVEDRVSGGGCNDTGGRAERRYLCQVRMPIGSGERAARTEPRCRPDAARQLESASDSRAWPRSSGSGRSGST